MNRIEELASLAEGGVEALDQRLLPLEEGLSGYPQVRLDAAGATRLRQGQAVETDGALVGRCVALDEAGRAVALAECDAHGRIRSLRGFNPA
jgi:tRNA pseudouridine55 synthase